MLDATAAADLMFRPAAELARLVRAGEVSARELVQASLDRIDALDSEINAFVDVFAQDALADADRVAAGDDRPFAGVPVAIKNNRGIQGKRLTFGADLFGDFAAPADHNVTRRLKEAGFVVVGTTTLPEYGILPTTQARRFGPTRNPWDPGRTPGGSSGGSAAAVAAGLVPVAHGNDGGGSIRIPAACCGLVGLKPQRGRISAAPEVGGSFLVVDGVLTRTVAETAQLLDVLAGPELGDAWWAPESAQPFAAAVGRGGPERALRIAVTTKSPVDAPVDARCVQATQDAAELLRSLGHEVVEAEPPWGDPSLFDTFTACFGPAVCTQIAFGGLLLGREPTAEDMEPLSWELFAVCKSIDSTTAALAELRMQAFGRGVVTWGAQFDAVLTPALAEAPVPLGAIHGIGERPLEDFARSARFTPFTPIANVSGSPAISLPLYEREPDDAAAGLPLAVQLTGQPGGEAALLALAAQVEAAHPWAGRRPPVS